MCGRFTHRLTRQQVHDLYRLTDPRQGALDLKPRYNVAPTDVMPVCRLNRSGQREIAMLKQARQLGEERRSGVDRSSVIAAAGAG